VADSSNSGDGLMSWLIGGLIVGVVVLGLVVGAYAVGYDRGEEAASSSAPAAETTDTPTEATEATGPVPLATGAEVFASAGCGGCHVLADAGAAGAVGPSLDELQPSAQRVAQVVTSGVGAMPSFEGQLSEAEIEAVAVYVDEVAGG
jgi:sulfite dehydrogenase